MNSNQWESVMSHKLKQDVSIGGNLKRLRLKAGYTQEEVAAKLQTMGLAVSREMLSQMEQGKYSIRISVLAALRTLYKTNFEDFFAGLYVWAGKSFLSKAVEKSPAETTISAGLLFYYPFSRRIRLLPQ